MNKLQNTVVPELNIGKKNRLRCCSCNIFFWKKARNAGSPSSYHKLKLACAEAAVIHVRKDYLLPILLCVLGP